MDDTADWFIVRTNPQGEKKAATEIRRRGHRAYMPKVSRVKINRRTKEKSLVFRPLFTGYLLVRFVGVHYDDLVNCQGVSGVLKRAGGAPATIPSRVIGALLRAQRAFKNEDRETRAYRKARRQGRNVSIDRAMADAIFEGQTSGLVIGGAFQGREVSIIGVTDNGMVQVEFIMLGGKSVRATLHALSEIVPMPQAPVQEISQAA